MGVSFERLTVVSALEDVTGAAMLPVEGLGEEAVEPLHPRSNVRLRGFDEQMVVGVHEAVHVAEPLEPLSHVSEECEEEPALLVPAQHGATVDASRRHVIEAAGDLESRPSSHEPRVRPWGGSTSTARIPVHLCRAYAIVKGP